MTLQTHMMFFVPVNSNVVHIAVEKKCMASLKWLLHDCDLVFALNVRDGFPSFHEMTNDRSYCHFWQIISPG